MPSTSSKTLTAASLFTGVGGFDLGFQRAGIQTMWMCEKDKACQSVLKRHWPEVPIYDDITELQPESLIRPDILTGGFPCQDVSVAGRREGLAGERSGLWFEFYRIIERVRPRWVVIENVPGLLSSNGGADFATILSGLVECGYGVAWRVLDAQYFGVPQRRRRVFIVGHLGDGRAAEVLFEREGGGGDIAEGRSKGAGTAPYAIRRAQTSSNGWGIQRDVTHTLDGTGGDVVSYVMAHGQANAEIVKDGSPSLTLNHEAPIVTTAFNGYTGGPDDNDAQGGHIVAVPLRAEGHDASEDGTGRQNLVVALQMNYIRRARIGDKVGTLAAQPGDAQFNGLWDMSHGVRRLTPVECERLQGFPDGHTEGQSDSARYRQMGNAVAVPVAEWIGRRIMEANG